MSWSVGYDFNWKRDIGHGVPAYCDHPDCGHEINRGLEYVCGGEPHGGEEGCGLYFCGFHLIGIPQKCARCFNGKEPFKITKGDHFDWLKFKLEDSSWKDWREENPQKVAEIKKLLKIDKAKK